jgi:hypothetical protein
MCNSYKYVNNLGCVLAICCIIFIVVRIKLKFWKLTIIAN